MVRARVRARVRIRVRVMVRVRVKVRARVWACLLELALAEGAVVLDGHLLDRRNN